MSEQEMSLDNLQLLRELESLMSVSSFQVYRCHSFSGVQDEAPSTPQYIPQNTELDLILVGPFQHSHPWKCSSPVWMGHGATWASEMCPLQEHRSSVHSVLACIFIESVRNLKGVPFCPTKASAACSITHLQHYSEHVVPFKTQY